MDTTSAKPNIKSLFSYGFRPFFLLAGLSSSIYLIAWLGVLSYGGKPSPYFDPLLWHAHEMLFGFTVAMIAGFLLTAVPNWSGVKAQTGTPLILLSLLWLAARISILLSGSPVTSFLDLAFLPALLGVIGLPLIRSKNPKFLVFLPILTILWVGNLLFHLQAMGVANTAKWGISISLSLIVVLIVIIGGRVIPFFTLRALKTTPKKWAVVDYLAPVTVLLFPLAELAPVSALVVWGILSLVIHVARMWGWYDRGVWTEPLLWVLYLGYAWVPFGILAKVGTGLSLFPGAVAVHALTAGAIGMVGLGMMARVSLGHSGRPLVAAKPMVVAFILVQLAAVLRVFGPIFFDDSPYYLSLSGLLWFTAFLIFVVVYFFIWATPRPDGKP